MSTRHISGVMAPADRQSLGATPRIISGGGSPSYSHEPAGAIPLLYSSLSPKKGWVMDWANVLEMSSAFGRSPTLAQPWQSICWPCDGVHNSPSFADTVSNQNGPVNPTIVGRQTFGPGTVFPPYGSPPEKITGYYGAGIVVPNVPFEVFYVSYWFKYSPNFFNMAFQLKHTNQWGNTGGTVVTAFNATTNMGVQSYMDPPYYVRIYNSDGDYTENADGPAVIENDVWYHLEGLYNWQTKHVTIYINGEEHINQTMTVWPLGGFGEHSWDWNYGGGGLIYEGLFPEMPYNIYMYMDDFYLSYTPT